LSIISTYLFKNGFIWIFIQLAGEVRVRMAPTEVRPVAREEEGETDPHGTISCEERVLSLIELGEERRGITITTQLLNEA